MISEACGGARLTGKQCCSAWCGKCATSLLCMLEEPGEPGCRPGPLTWGCAELISAEVSRERSPVHRCGFAFRQGAIDVEGLEIQRC